MTNGNNKKQFYNTIEDQIQYLYPETSDEFSWDPEASSKEITFSKDFKHAFLYEANYYFRTITSNRPFFNGVHYWEIIADARTQIAANFFARTAAKEMTTNVPHAPMD